MAEKKKSVFGDVRSRNVFVSIIAMSGLMVVAAIFLSGGKDEGAVEMQSEVAATKKTNSKPGGNNSPRYQQYVKDENEDRAEEAESTGGSSIPTIFSGGITEEPFIVEEEEMQEPATSASQSGSKNEAPSTVEQQQVQPVVVREVNKAKMAQMKALMTSWSESSGTSHIGLKVVPQYKPEVVIAANSVEQEPEVDKLMYRAGSMISAVIDTELSSDYPGAVRASVVSGPLRGAYVIGSFQRQQDTVLLSFNSISLKGVGSKGVSMVAVDPHTGNSGVKSEVDNHYLSRYASLMGGVFVSSLGIYGELTGEENTASTTDANGNTVVTRGEITESDKIIAAVGGGFTTIADNAGEEIAAGFDRAVTVKVNQGQAINLFVLQDIPESILK